MRLLYFYAKFYDMQGHPALYRGFPSWSINFSPQHYFRFLPETGQLSEPESDRILPQVPDGFWGERIYNATAFVSGNGGGKSTIMQYLLRLLVDLVQNLPSPTQVAEDWVIVFEVDGEIIALQNQSILARAPCQLLHARCGVTCLCCGNTKNSAKLNHLHRHLRQTKLLYLTNVLSKADTVFQDEWLIREPDRAKRVLFDASPYALMRQEEKECEAGDDILQKFFLREQDRMLRFLTSPGQRSLLMHLRKMDYPVSVPQQLTVYVQELAFPEEVLSRGEPELWEQAAFPLSWQNVSATDGDTPALRVEKIIFKLCHGAVAACWRNFDSIDVYRDWFDTLKHLGKAGVSGGAEHQVSGEEFLYFIDMVYELYVRAYFAEKKPESAFQAAKRYVGACQDFIRFLCSQRSRERLVKYLPPVDPTDWQMRQLGIQVPVKFVIPLDVALAEEDSEDRSVWFVDFYQHYLNVCGSTPFLTLDWGMSSGEENLLKMFTNLEEVCHPVGQHGPGICNAGKQANDNICSCTTVWLFLDEADLTYHPEWQRQFMAVLTAFLQAVYPPEICREMQIFLSTHSPLMLGDFPGRCVAYLRYKEDGTRYVDDTGRVDTFGENLFTLLHDSFYLKKGEIGELARRKIQNVIDFLTKVQKELDSPKSEEVDKANVCNQLNKYRNEVVVLLADGPIKTKLWLDINRLEDQIIRSSGDRDALIQALEAKLDRLKRGEDLT